MKVAYVTPYASGDVHAWSGSVFHVREALANAGCDILPVDSLNLKAAKIEGKLMSLAFKYLTGKTFLSDRTPGILRACAEQVEFRCEHIGPDVIFSPGSIPIAKVKSDKPIVFWTDATFAGIKDYYRDFSNLAKLSVWQGSRAEQQALTNCSLAIYTSEWAAKSAVDHYDVDPAKVKVVPFGANVSAARDEAVVRGLVAARDLETCELLFVGVDWERKGGPIALRTAEILKSRGLAVRLHVVGCEPPGELPDFVVRHGFISKKFPAGAARLAKLFSDAHFLIVPSRAECFGLVFAEAGSFGLPSLAAITGGVPSVVTSGKNGMLFPLEDEGEGYADFIQAQMADPAAYEALALGSFEEFKARLNWDVAGETVVSLMRGLVGQRIS
ncbi:glycosyltransferase family 4 protein [Luteolibacter sp. SL250]|uniref:glycosyltransferase family 4 protein n=1 Tax=Luteolibacter sp. SL250 TaxID=2995170 RepID=UPI002271E0D5|nr:glycosyltransferase family 4 protein [Luteolibacter sp. SL250]WAC20736.1 glycosyltransferase family 4 protein [Luteolibacter sp. SL250]